MSIADSSSELAFLKNRVAELESKESLLQAEYKYLRKLYDQAPLAYQSLDDTGCFLEVNHAWLETLGYTREEVIGKNFGEFLHPDWRDHYPVASRVTERTNNKFGTNEPK